MNVAKVIDTTFKVVVIGSALAKVAVIGLLAYGVNKKYQPADSDNNSNN